MKLTECYNCKKHLEKNYIGTDYSTVIGFCGMECKIRWVVRNELGRCLTKRRKVND